MGIEELSGVTGSSRKSDKKPAATKNEPKKRPIDFKHKVKTNDADAPKTLRKSGKEPIDFRRGNHVNNDPNVGRNGGSINKSVRMAEGKEKPTPAAKTPHKLPTKTSMHGAPNYKELVDDLYDSMVGVGTNDPQLEKAMDKFKEKGFQIVDFMKQWEDRHPGSETFIEMFMADATHSQKIKYGRMMQGLLYEKAQQLGVDLSKDEHYKRIDQEMGNKFGFIDNRVADDYNAIIKDLAKKEGLDYHYTAYSMLPKVHP